MIHPKDKLKNLQDAFNFSVKELELNRAGQLSSVQEKRLESHRAVRGCGRRAAFIGLGGTALLAFLVPLFLANEPGIEQARPYIWGVAGFILALVLIFG